MSEMNGKYLFPMAPKLDTYNLSIVSSGGPGNRLRSVCSMIEGQTSDRRTSILELTGTVLVPLHGDSVHIDVHLDRGFSSLIDGELLPGNNVSLRNIPLENGRFQARLHLPALENGPLELCLSVRDGISMLLHNSNASRTFEDHVPNVGRVTLTSNPLMIDFLQLGGAGPMREYTENPHHQADGFLF
jgi:hypothetical protein